MSILLNFCFFELDMLLCDWIIFPLSDFIGHRARVFLGDVEKARIRSRKKFNLNRCCLRHGDIPLISNAHGKAAAKFRGLKWNPFDAHPSDPEPFVNNLVNKALFLLFRYIWSIFPRILPFCEQVRPISALVKVLHEHSCSVPDEKKERVGRDSNRPLSFR